MKTYFTILKKTILKTFTIKGRSDKKEVKYYIYFWMGSLVFLDLSSKYLSFINSFFSAYMLLSFLPIPTLFCRRMHDLGKKGWWAWIPFYNSVMFVEDGTLDDNQFGSSPTKD